jgi:phospholipid/cholesterol/gamma-HCH transport system ATP-binding protein
MIVLDHLTKAFGAKRVLNDLCLEVPDGQNTVIIGYSGSGKSVTLKCVVGLLEPDGGRVVVDDEVVHEMSRERLTVLGAGSGTSSSSPRSSTR